MRIKRFKLLVLSVGVLALAGTAGAFVVGGSNLPIFGYDEHDCYEPRKPISSDRYELDRFQQDLRDYAACIEEYVDNADSDILRIREAQDAAIEDLERVARL